METVFNVVEDNVEEGIAIFTYRNKERAKNAYDDIVTHYKNEIKELGNGEINDYFAEITDKWDDEVARVFWTQNIVE